MERKRYRNILLVNPAFPISYWSMHYTMRSIGKKGLVPPLGLLTIASLTPSHFNLRLVDLNCEPLTEEMLEWAEIVCFSAMFKQKDSLFETAERVGKAGKLRVFGGPFPSASPEKCRPYCEVLVLDEGEVTWPVFLRDLEGGQVRKRYRAEEKADLSRPVVPRFDLVDVSQYIMLTLQISRGCPHDCEFCDITAMFGRKMRTKPHAHVLRELQAIYDTGYRAGLFFVDDNFIGDKRYVRDFLPKLTAWNKEHNSPYLYLTQCTLDLAQDDDLLRKMVEANFRGVFLGIETPSAESLRAIGKLHNLKGGPMVEAVEKIQRAGMVVHAGFMMGFDSDGPDIFDRQIEFVRKAAIPCAYTELVHAFPKTRLYRRLEKEGRIRQQENPSTDEFVTNFETVLPRQGLLAGFKRVIENIYSPDDYFKRCSEQLSRMPRFETPWGRLYNAIHYGRSIGEVFRKGDKRTGRMRNVFSFFTSQSKEFNLAAAKFFLKCLRHCPERLPAAIFYLLAGAHFCRYSAEYVIPKIDMELQKTA